MEPDKEQEMSNFGQILKEIGEFGLFQKRTAILICIPSIFGAFDLVSQAFTSLSFPHHCNTDWILKPGPNLTEERQRNLTIPVNEDGNFESCKMFTPVDLDLETIEKYGINTTTECVNGNVFDIPKGTSTFLTEFDLVCERSSIIEVSQSLHMVGFLIGSLTSGLAADRFGRRFVVLLALLFQLLCAVGVALSPNIYVYTAFKFIGGITTGAYGVNAFVIGGEWTDASKFALCTIIGDTAYSFGLILLSGYAYLIHDWRILQLVLFSPLVVVVALFYWFIPESARWLYTQGRKDEARKLIERAATANGRKVPEDLLEKLEFEQEAKRGTMLDIFRISYLRKRALIMNCVWFGIGLMYYGLSLNVGSFGLNIYLTQVVFALVEFPAYLGLAPVTQYFGRRICQSVTLFIGGFACLIIIAVPQDLPVVITVVAVLGKFFAAATFSLAYVYTAELYPTIVRQNGVGLNAMFARMGGMLSPLIRLLDVLHPAVPMLMYGFFPVIAAGLCLMLPETANQELQDFADPEVRKEDTGEKRFFEPRNKLVKSTKL